MRGFRVYSSFLATVFAFFTFSQSALADIPLNSGKLASFDYERRSIAHIVLWFGVGTAVLLAIALYLAHRLRKIK